MILRNGKKIKKNKFNIYLEIKEIDKKKFQKNIIYFKINIQMKNTKL